ncbi:hypothetical protein [Parasitella parasitica]|uniref:Uncharacterized protein n=1 Tax=Parasitella parasitica TaxID=35722 RepID=A0A0B7NJV0_9FUNG|nr:hypothetical protein [Parasitella parasitica]
MPASIEDPLSYLLNCLPTTFRPKKARNSIGTWYIRWPTICAILQELDSLAHHSQIPEPSNHLGESLIQYLHHLQSRFSDD